MKKALKFLFLPIAFSCCSMTSNVTSIQFVAFSIVDEDTTKGTFKLCAYIDILIRNLDKVCSYEYSWTDGNGEVHLCGASSIVSLTKKTNYPLTGCNEISVEDLNENSPVTFTCRATVSKEATYYTTLNYNGKTTKEFVIDESVNNQELSTGFLKESTFTDHQLDYRYEDVLTFLNYEDLRIDELYYALDISYLRFKYRNGLDNTLKGEFRFAFYDRYNLFPDFPIGESMYRYIPLTFNRDQEECYFTFTPTIYYDPTTHMSSLIKKDNYLPYHRLMLPFGYASELRFLPCYLELQVHSHTDFKITGKFMMSYVKNYIGDCEDSEFCDELHQDEEINVREKIVEVVI